ncbi:MAG: hypothetical protein Q4P29_04270 [Tissierellia bacterium]|nr:hypothetical protein [Tissierellia bacterium]
MKKFISLMLILTILFTLSACGKKKPKDKDIVTPTEENTVGADKDSIKPNESNTVLPEKADEQTENPETDENKEPEMTEEEKELQKSYEEQIKALIENSHYISIIKMTQTGAAGKEIHVIEDFKGSLKNIELPEIKNLEANKDYLIFFRDSDTGDLIPTDSEKGIVELQGDDDQALKIVRDVLSPEPTEEKENK